MKGPLFVFLALVVVAFAGAAIWLWTPDRSRGELEALYLRSPDDMTEVAGTQLHARDDGPRDAPVLIMLHGFGSSLHTWEPWAQALVGKYRVIRLDLPGAGLSPPDPTNDYTDARSIALILALMDRRSVLRATLVGNSLGGRIAWTLAAKHPERTDKLVLISPDGFASPGLEYGKAPDVPIALQAMQYVLPKALLQMSLEPSYGDPSVMSTVTVDRYHHLMLAPGVRKALLARMEQTVLVPPKPLLRSIKAPVLLLWGEKDMLIPFSNAADYAKNVPDIRLVSFPELGHVPHEEAPELSLTPLRAFLTERS
ncbi:MAG: alpha/beta fold hydrolase [Hyphomonadaceae bacterium]